MRITRLLFICLLLTTPYAFGAGEACSIALKGLNDVSPDVLKESTVTRFKELRGTLQKSWLDAGFTQTQVDDMVRKLQDGISNGDVVWSKANFRYVSKNGDVLGAQLIPSNMQNALRKAQAELAQNAAKLGDDAAQEVAQQIATMRQARDQIIDQAKRQGWAHMDLDDGRKVVEIRQLDTSTQLGQKLASEVGYVPGRKVVMSFNEEGTGVALHLVGSDGKLMGAVKNLDASEFQQLLFN